MRSHPWLAPFIALAFALALDAASPHGAAAHGARRHEALRVARAAIQPIDGTRVERGYVVVGSAGRDDQQAVFLGEHDPEGTGNGPRSIRVSVLATDLGAGFTLLAGGITRRVRPMIGAESEGITAATLVYHRAFLIERDTHVELIVDTRVSVSFAQRTRTDESFLREVDGGLRLCSSQSDAGIDVGVRIAHNVEIRAGYEVQDDPFHFDGGYGCLGDGPIWSHSETVSGILRIRVAGRARVGVHLVHRRTGLGWDVHGAERSRGLAAAEGTTVMAALELDL